MIICIIDLQKNILGLNDIRDHWTESHTLTTTGNDDEEYITYGVQDHSGDNVKVELYGVLSTISNKRKLLSSFTTTSSKKSAKSYANMRYVAIQVVVKELKGNSNSSGDIFVKH